MNPLLRADPPVDGFRDLDEALEELIDDEVRQRLRAKRQVLSSALCPEEKGLKYLRLLGGFSQRELADAIGTSQPRLSVWENNPDSMSIGSTRALARALGVDYNTFFKAVFGE
jgi:DNA-binding XRE family transcriptional regulator